MLNTYRAILRGQTIEWLNEKPENLSRNRPVNVHVTILEDNETPLPAQGQQMAAILEQLAQIQSSFAILDPLDWEREIRQDRELPGRTSHAD